MRVKVNKFHPEFDKANNPDQLIMQDFYATIYLSNLMALAEAEANEKHNPIKQA